MKVLREKKKKQVGHTKPYARDSYVLKFSTFSWALLCVHSDKRIKEFDENGTRCDYSFVE